MREGCAPGGPGARRTARAIVSAETTLGRAAVGPARLATVVSLPTARAARFGVSAPNTPKRRGSAGLTTTRGMER